MPSSALAYLCTLENLQVVWKDYWKHARRKSAAGIDGVTPQAFHNDLGRRLRLLRDELRDGYSFSALRGVAVPKKDISKMRLICVPTVADRVVQRAILNLVESAAVRLGVVNDVSFGFVKAPIGEKRGTHAARQTAIRLRQERPWALKADISAFFDNIEREALASDFTNAFRKRSLLPLIRGVIRCEVNAADSRIRRVLTANGIKAGVGLRQGMPLSPILSNVVLRHFDRRVGRANAMVRYADDFVIFANSEAECEDAKELVSSELGKLGLSLSATKTAIYPPGEAVEFLGLELGLTGTTGEYGLTISAAQMNLIKETFRASHDWTLAAKEGLDVSRLFQRLEQIKAGYRTAYGVADNFRVLDERLSQWARDCATAIYSSMFGKGAVAKLTEAKQAFLMIR
jgi:RNA-directed DNA polymerase